MAGKESSSSLVPARGTGIEECWMEIEGARMRYLRTVSQHQPKRARSKVRQSPPLILIHGLLGYSFSWRYTMPALAPYTTVYAPDLLGAGFSDRPPGLDNSLRATARRLLSFIAGLGISSFDLLGTSHGGAVAMMMAAECAEATEHSHGLRLRRLVLAEPLNPFSSHGRWLAPFVGGPLGTALFRLLVAPTHFFYPLAHARMYGDRKRIPAGAIEGYMAPLAIPGLFEHALGIVRTWTPDLRQLKAALPKLADFPTLFIWGSKDEAVPVSSAVPLAKYFHHSETVIFPGIGHLPYEECPEGFNRALIEFLTK
jgi:pimeloyl-ACP methyl ester carboxylesterase